MLTLIYLYLHTYMNCFVILQAKDLEAGNVECDRPVRSKYLVLKVINDRFFSSWAIFYIVFMSLIITFMIMYGEHIYKAIGNAFNDEVKFKLQ